MTEVSYDKAITAQLIIDPYNDFISEGGKVWDRLRGVAEANDCVVVTENERDFAGLKIVNPLRAN